MNTSTENPETSSPAATDQDTGRSPRPQPICRPAHDRMLAGVAAGLADYLNIDATIVRIVFAVLAVAGGAGVPLYLAGWLLIPEEGAEQSIASDLIQSVTTRSH
jgi:phage shock protein PspC (stress-responsive transcriptional regulator)